MTEPKPKSTTRPYVVGYVTPDHTLKLVGSYSAATPKGAVEKCVEKAAGELPQIPLNFVAVVSSSWNAFHGAGEMKMVFNISEGHEAAGEGIDGPHHAPPPDHAEGPRDLAAEAAAAPTAVIVDSETEIEAEPSTADAADTLTDEQARVIAEAEAGEFGEVG